MSNISTIKTLGDLRRVREASPEAFPRRPVKDEVRDNLIAKLRSGETLFPGIIGYDDTVIPQLVNAILSRHNFILLGLRGQAKSRILTCAQVPAAPVFRSTLKPVWLPEWFHERSMRLGDIGIASSPEGVAGMVMVLCVL